MREPRDPLLKVLFLLRYKTFVTPCLYGEARGPTVHRGVWIIDKATRPITNDPSAGSPTETLLRLLLPLNDQV